MGAGPEPALVVLVQELRLVGGHVDADRAVAGARLAGQAQIEGVAHLCRAPAVLNRLAPHQLLEQAGPAPGGVVLLPRGPVTGTHHTARVAAAPADADTAAYRSREAVLIVRE